MKSIKPFIMGMLLATLIYSVFPTFADTIQVAFNSINLIINGQTKASIGQSYTLDSGVSVPYSIVYKGTTYLPIRVVSELLDKNVTWDNISKTVSIKGIVKEEIIPAEDKGTSEFTQIYDAFIKDFQLVQTQVTPHNEILYNANYVGSLDQASFWEYWNTIEKSIKESIVKEYGKTIQLKNPQYTIAINYKYNGVQLGYVFAYPEGHQLCSFVPNPFNIHQINN